MKWITGISLGVCLLSVVGCGTPSTSAVDNTNSATSSSAQNIVVTDQTKTTLHLTRPATRFVCLDGAAIQMLVDMGVKAKNIAFLGSEKTFAQLPFVLGSQAKNSTIIGGTWQQPNVEDIVAFHPDLVIGDAYPHVQLRNALRGTAPMYLFSRSDGYKGSLQNLINVGILAGQANKAKQLANQIQRQINRDVQEVSNITKKRTSLIIWGYSTKSFQVAPIVDPSSSVLATVSQYPWGGQKAGGMSISLSKILQVNPDVIFVESFTRLQGSSTAPLLSQELAKNPLWNQLKAVKNHRVYEVDPNIWQTDRSAMGLVKILNDAMPRLYPDLNANQ